MSRIASNSRASGSGPHLPWPLIAMVTNRRLYAGCTSAAGVNAECAALVGAAATAAHAGVDLVQIRERGMEDAALLALAEAVREASVGSGARVLVNDRVDVALAARVAGVHLPGRAVECARVRAIVPERFLIGRSVHSVEEAAAAASGGGCDYLVFGSVFESQSKPAGHPVAGIDALAEVCAAVSLPVLAVGGVTTDRVPEVARAGAAGVAAIGLFAGGTDRELRRTVGEIREAFRR
jgi:thiamine-phosphate pyrophosphorylase